MVDLPIENLCWTALTAVTYPRVKVQHLERAARDAEPRPFVVHDEAWRMSAIVAPRSIGECITRFGLEDDADAGDVGLLDFLSGGQITVSADAPASVVVRVAVEQGSTAVIAVDASSRPQGVFIPSSVVARLRETLIERYTSLPAELRLAADRLPMTPEFGDVEARALIDAVDTLSRHQSRFHSENLNQRSPVIGVCPDHGLSHLTPLPCRDHGAVQAVLLEIH